MIALLPRDHTCMCAGMHIYEVMKGFVLSVRPERMGGSCVDDSAPATQLLMLALFRPHLVPKVPHSLSQWSTCYYKPRDIYTFIIAPSLSSRDAPQGMMRRYESPRDRMNGIGNSQRRAVRTESCRADGYTEGCCAFPSHPSVVFGRRGDC